MHTGTVILLWPIVRCQGEPLQSYETNGGAESHIQLVEDPTLEQVAAPEESHDSEGSLHWNGPSTERISAHGRDP